MSIRCSQESLISKETKKSCVPEIHLAQNTFAIVYITYTLLLKILPTQTLTHILRDTMFLFSFSVNRSHVPRVSCSLSNCCVSLILK